MCGIAGYVSRNNFDRELNQAIDSLTPRGPDFLDKKTFQIKNTSWQIGLGHTRLSIQDLDTVSNQPMLSACGQYEIIYNGEIYNNEFLIEKFGLSSLRTSSDTEVLLEAYAKFGVDSIKFLDGIFAFVIYEKKKNKVILCRDPFGIKPLYFSNKNNQLFIASEIKALKNFITPVICKKSFVEALRLGFLTEPNSGFSNISKLTPGTIMEVSMEKGLISKTYQYITDLKSSKDKNEFLSNIKNQLISDRPLGLMYSSGCDSNILSELFGDNIKSRIMAIYEGKEKIESPGEFKVTKNFFNYSGDIIKAAQDVVNGVEEPISDFTYVITAELSRTFSENGIRVVFSGMGGDEVFGDYPRDKLRPMHKYRLVLYPLVKVMNFILKSLNNNFLSKKRDRLISFLSTEDPLIAYSQLIGYFSLANLKDILNLKYTYLLNEIDRDWNKLAGDNPNKLIPNFERLGFLAHNLMVADKAGMSQGVEIRVPFLSLSNVNYDNFSGSIGYTRNSLLKFLNKKVYRKVQSKNKDGFNPPLESLVNSNTSDFYLNYFLDSKLLEFISYNHIEDIVISHFEGKNNQTYKIWQIIFLNEWLLKYD